MLSRRGFLRIAGLLGLSPIASTVGRAQDTSTLSLDEYEYYITFPSDQIRVIQGATNSSSTILTIVAHTKANLQIEIYDEDRVQRPFDHDLIDLKLGDFIVHQIYVEDLELSEEYTLSILNKTSGKQHSKKFRALDWNKTDTKIAVLTCSNHRDAKPKSIMFKQLFESKPDVIFFSGDLVYANSALDTVMNRPAAPRDAYNVYTKTVMEFELYQRERLVPIFTTWDDHDLAFNNSNINHPHKKTMRKIFRAFFPIDSKVQGISQGPGLSFSFNAFGMQIFFLDVRYYKNNGSQELLGREQMHWLQSDLATSASPILFVSAQQFLNYRSLAESYQKNASREFSEFLKLIKPLKRPTLFVSGDVHYSQIQEMGPDWMGHKTYEITSSAFFSSSARSFGKRRVEDGQLAYYGYPNFLMFEEITAQPNFLEFKLSCISESSKKQFTKKLKIQI